MEKDSEQTRSLLSSQQTPVAIVPPIYNEKEGVVKQVDAVLHEYALAIIINQDTTPNAKSWQEQSIRATDTWLQLNLMLLAVEYANEGSCYIDVSKEENPSTYWRTMEAIARRMCGCEKPYDTKMINENMKSRFEYHKNQIADLNFTYKRIKEEKEREKEKKEDGERERLAKKAKKAAKDAVAAAGADAAEADAIGDLFGAAAGLGGGPAAPERVWILEEELQRDHIFEDSRLMSPMRSDEIDASIRIPLAGADVMQKVTFTVSAVPDKDGKIIGYLVRLLVHDASWNMGRFIETLIKQCQNREKNGKLSYYVEPWPQYAMLQGTNHPVHNMTHDRWMQCFNSLNGEQPNFAKRIMQNGLGERIDTYTSLCHPKNVCTLIRALKRLKEAGGVNCETEHLSAFGHGTDTAKWPFPKTVRYASKQVFWFHPKWSGFMNQYFPFATTMIPEDSPELYHYLRHTDLYSKDQIRSLSPKFSTYKTGNLFVHWAIDADISVDKLDKLFPVDYYEAYQCYLKGIPIDTATQQAIEIYQREVKRHSTMWMEKFLQLCQLEGSPEFLQISKTGKAMITWYQEYMKSVSTSGNANGITREIELYDDELDLFSNWVIRQMLQYEKFGKIVQPIIPFKVRGCFSVYQRRMGQLLYNMNLYGGGGAGKSHSAIGFLQTMAIPGTFIVYDKSTNAADQTDQSVDDEIRGQHEMDEAFVSEAEGKKHMEKVNLKKTALTSGVLTIKVFEHQKIAGVEGQFRSARTVIQAQNYSEVTCTNTVPDEGALGSRYHNVLIGDSSIPIHQMHYKVTSESKKEILNDFRVNQFLSFWTEKAMAIYAIPCRAPFMGLFHDISSRMIDSLTAWGALPKGVQVKRCHDLMEPMARQLTIDKANLLTFHTAGGKHFREKKFDPKHLTDLAPLLYCDSNITLFAWTLHSSDWIQSDYGKILLAAWKIATGNVAWNGEKSLYRYYQEDTKNLIHFKTVKNLTWTKEIHGTKNRTYTDLNMIDMGCSLEHAAQRISAATQNPKIPAAAVKGILEKLCLRQFSPRTGGRNGYTQSLFTDDLLHHKAKEEQKKLLTLMGYKSLLRSWCHDISLTFYKEAIIRLKLKLDTFTNSRGPLESITRKVDELIVFTCIAPIGTVELVPGETPECPPQLMYPKDVKKIPKEKMIEIVKSFDNVKFNESEDDPYTTIPNLEYIDAMLILYGFEKGVFRKFGDSSKTYLKLEIIQDPMGIEFPKYPSESDLPMLEGVAAPIDDIVANPKMISVVEVARGKLYFSPMAIELFDSSIIQDAFIDAILCSSTTPGKRLLGWTDERDVSKFKTFRLLQETIKQKVKEFDDDAGPGATLRANGIPFTRRGHIEDSSKAILYGIGNVSAPMSRHHARSVEVIDNLDKWAATQQFLICGLPFTEPVRDPEWIRKNYTGNVGKVDYPDAIIREKLAESAKNLEPNGAESRKRSRKIAKIQ